MRSPGFLPHPLDEDQTVRSVSEESFEHARKCGRNALPLLGIYPPAAGSPLFRAARWAQSAGTSGPALIEPGILALRAVEPPASINPRT